MASILFADLIERIYIYRQLVWLVTCAWSYCRVRKRKQTEERNHGQRQPWRDVRQTGREEQRHGDTIVIVLLL